MCKVGTGSVLVEIASASEVDREHLAEEFAIVHVLLRRHGVLSHLELDETESSVLVCARATTQQQIASTRTRTARNAHTARAHSTRKQANKQTSISMHECWGVVRVHAVGALRRVWGGEHEGGAVLCS
jgi:hypothetical protein